MKCAYFVFLLLIGISCQIGCGHCAPDGILYDSQTSMIKSFTNKVSGAFNYGTEVIKNTMNAMTPDLKPESMKHELSNMKESIGNMANKARGMVSSGIKEINDKLLTVN